MMRGFRLILPLAALLSVGSAVAQTQQFGPDSPEDTRKALADAQAQGEAARQRAEGLEASATTAREAADKTAQEAAALAARVQQAEAGIAAGEARIKLIDAQRGTLRAQLAQRQRPVVQLTAALQRLARRPAVLSLFRPGSLQDTIYLRAALESMLPEVARRTSALRAEIAKSRLLQQQAEQANAGLRASQQDLAQRRQTLAALETKQRLELRSIGGVADRENERALALAEQARDLSGLVAKLGESSALREQLAQLPGPVLRPARPDLAQVAPEPTLSATASALGRYLLPVAGRLIAGFGDLTADGTRSRGLALAARPTAQVVAPAAGRVAFAGVYQGFGNIVIIEHEGGWTTLVTGLAQLDTRVGDRLVSGSPLGLTGPGRPVVTLELRRGGEPVNPLDAVAAG
jgi:septal ring factor EnvC (AmiA/AmiB activator)